jgi:glutathione S-transferase
VDQWLDYSNFELDPVALSQIFPVIGVTPVDPALHTVSQAEIKHQLEVLDGYLKDKTYFVGSGVTIADLSIANLVNQLYVFVVDEKLREQYPNVLKWY